jgi:excisionase family DNA binding protein
MPVVSEIIRNQQQPLKLLYSIVEVARILGIELRTVRRLIRLRELTVHIIGRRVLIGHGTLVNFIRTHDIGGYDP